MASIRDSVKFLIYPAVIVLTLLLTVSGIIVLPFVGDYVRETLFHLSRCRSPLSVGQAQRATESLAESNQSIDYIEQVSTFLVLHMNHLLVLSYACIGFFFAGALPFLIHGQWGLDTAYLILSISVLYLLAFQFPRIESPQVHLSYVGTAESDFCDQHCKYLELRKGKSCRIQLSIANVGLIYYKHCTVWICFPTDFTIHETGHKLYSTLSNRKAIRIQDHANICLISPRDNDLSVAPFATIQIPICVHVPQSFNTSRGIKLEVSVDSESTWGVTTNNLRLLIS